MSEPTLPTPWFVIVEGDVDCEHSLDSLTIRVAPPTQETVCSKCGRKLRCYTDPVSYSWINEDALPPKALLS